MRLSSWVRFGSQIFFAGAVMALGWMYFQLLYGLISVLVAVGIFVLLEDVQPDIALGLRPEFSPIVRARQLAGNTAVALALGLLWLSLPVILTVERFSEWVVNERADADEDEDDTTS